MAGVPGSAGEPVLVVQHPDGDAMPAKAPDDAQASIVAADNNGAGPPNGPLPRSRSRSSDKGSAFVH